MTLARMTLASEGTLDLGAMRLEYRMIGPLPHVAPTIVMLHEGLGCVGLWGDFPDQLQAATGEGQGKTRRVESAGSRPALGGDFKPPR